MRSFQRRVTWLMLACFSLQVVLPNTASADKFFSKLGRLVHETEYCGTPPEVCEDCAVETLAENIDWLEHHIDCYGSIVAKQPDIWGEARLTKHRDEFERVLYQELNQFEFKLNAAIKQTDASFAAAALALSNAAAGDSVVDPNGKPVVISVNNILPSTPSTYVDPNTNRRIDLKRFASDKIDIEPTVYLDQLNRYVHHLHELRRINEGDDTSDSPGYSLNLVRVPVSILPGKITREGFGAEITITAESHLSDDLLPTTFRNLVVNDVIRQNALPVTRQLLNDPKGIKKTLTDFEYLNYRLIPWMEGYDGWLARLERELGQLRDPKRISEVQRTIEYFHRQREYLMNRFLQIAVQARSQKKNDCNSYKNKEACSDVVPREIGDFFVYEEVRLDKGERINLLKEMLKREFGYENEELDGENGITKVYDCLVRSKEGKLEALKEEYNVITLQKEKRTADKLARSTRVLAAEAKQSLKDKQRALYQAKCGKAPELVLSAVENDAIKAFEEKRVAEITAEQAEKKLKEVTKELTDAESNVLRDLKKADFYEALVVLEQILGPNDSCFRWGITWHAVAEWMDELAKRELDHQNEFIDIDIRYDLSLLEEEKSVSRNNGKKCRDTFNGLSKVKKVGVRFKRAWEIDGDLSITRRLLPLQIEIPRVNPVDPNKQNNQRNQLESALSYLGCSFGEDEPTEPLLEPTSSQETKSKAVRDYLRTELLQAYSLILQDRSTAKQLQNYITGLYNNYASSALQMSGLSPELEEFISITSVSSSLNSELNRPLSPSQYIPVYGIESFLNIVAEAHRTFEYDPHRRATLSILDVRQYLNEEVHTSYDWLSDPSHLHLWQMYCTPELASAIERHDLWAVNKLRRAFMREAGVSSERFIRAALAWGIIVDAALLNRRLNDDVRKIAKAKGCCELQPGRELAFFIPESVNRPLEGLDEQAQTHMQTMQAELQEAAFIFQQYVKCRWPIHVFAIDPREQDQNVADFSARRRELQLALSMGFVNGEIGANTLMQHSRALETEIETISLNRTIAGFGHGTDTFGWRFFPRVQALDVPGAAGSIWQSIGGVDRDCDLCHRQIEPGMRECVAIVLMPSFVPYADFTVRSNWFKLTNPRNAALTMKDTMMLSKAITAMRHSRAQCAQCAHCYRPNEIRHLMTRVGQLDKELPLQSMRTQVPYENRLGGFEMFNTGVTTLAPELIGWYGAPGVVCVDSLDNRYHCGCYSDCEYCKSADSGCHRETVVSDVINRLGITSGKALPFPICEGEGTTFFLVGNNFSVHDTKVIAGGVCIPHVRLISRELMRVTIPSCVNKIKVREEGKDKEYVSVVVSTPYGVTNHLNIPVVGRELDKETKEAIEKAVKKEVETTVNTKIDGLTLAPQDVLIDYKKDAKMEIEALCEKKNPGKLIFVQKPGTEIPDAMIEVRNPFLRDPAHPAKATFSVSATHKGKYLTPMLPVKENVVLEKNMTIDSEDYSSAVKHEIMKAIAGSVSVSDLLDGKEDAKLVFFMNLTSCHGMAPSVRLMKEIPIAITTPCQCCDAAATGTTEEPASAETKSEETSGTNSASTGTSPAAATGITVPTSPTKTSLNPESIQLPSPDEQEDASTTSTSCNCSDASTL